MTPKRARMSAASASALIVALRVFDILRAYAR